MAFARVFVLKCVCDLVETLVETRDTQCHGSGSGIIEWNGMSEKEKLLHTAGVKKVFSDELEGRLKSGAAKVWVDGFTMHVSKLERGNCGFKNSVKGCVFGLIV